MPKEQNKNLNFLKNLGKLDKVVGETSPLRNFKALT